MKIRILSAEYQILNRLVTCKQFAEFVRYDFSKPCVLYFLFYQCYL